MIRSFARSTSTDSTLQMRSDVTWSWLASQPGVQMWTISVASVPDGNAIGSPVSTYKVTQV